MSCCARKGMKADVTRDNISSIALICWNLYLEKKFFEAKEVQEKETKWKQKLGSTGSSQGVSGDQLRVSAEPQTLSPVQRPLGYTPEELLLGYLLYGLIVQCLSFFICRTWDPGLYITPQIIPVLKSYDQESESDFIYSRKSLLAETMGLFW
jgi:hypothetical protein